MNMQRRGRAARGRLTSSPVVESVGRFVNTNPLGRFVLPLAVLAIAFTYPFWYETPGIAAVTGDILGLDLNTAILIAVYVISPSA